MPKPLAERFWEHVKKPGDGGEDGCWEWQGALRNGYGHFWISDEYPYYRQAHRVSWELAHGPISEEVVLCHKCDNPPCVRPDHLFPGTRGDNRRDAQYKGRLGNGLRTHCRNGHELPKGVGMGRCEICRALAIPKTGIRYRPRRLK